MKPCLRHWVLEDGEGLSPLWDRVSCSLCPQALRGSAGSAVQLAINLRLGQSFQTFWGKQ